MSLLGFLAGAAGAWITAALGMLVLLILSLPKLLGAACRGMWALLVPSRRAQWLQGRREKRERHQRVVAEARLFGSEVEQYGRDEALRRSRDRMYHRTTGTGQDDKRTA